MNKDRKELIDRFQKCLDADLAKSLIATECANIAESYAEMKLSKCEHTGKKTKLPHVPSWYYCLECETPFKIK